MKNAAIAITLIILAINSATAEETQKKEIKIASGEYILTNFTDRAIEHYGPKDRKINVKVEGNIVIFEGMKEIAYNKTPRFDITQAIPNAGNLILISADKKGQVDVIKCMASFVGTFELHRIETVKDE